MIQKDDPSSVTKAKGLVPYPKGEGGKRYKSKGVGTIPNTKERNRIKSEFNFALKPNQHKGIEIIHHQFVLKAKNLSKG